MSKFKNPKQRCKDDSENSLEDVACSCQSQAGPSNVFMKVVTLGTGDGPVLELMRPSPVSPHPSLMSFIRPEDSFHPLMWPNLNHREAAASWARAGGGTLIIITNYSPLIVAGRSGADNP